MDSFIYENKTRYVFGEGEHRRIGELVKPLVKSRLLLHYGGGSVKRSGVYDSVLASLREAGIEVVELGGVKPNPSTSLVREGIALCRREGVDFVLALGGGSVIDSAKGIALGVPSACEDVWKLYTGEAALDYDPLPVGAILTLPAAGSENSHNTVLTDEATGRKLGYGDMRLRPALSIVDPTLFLTLPAAQMAYGACDMLCHIFERYFTNTQHTELSDALAEATMKTIMQQALILRREPQNVTAWGQLALSGTIAHNDLLGAGREQSWACHALEHELSALYDVPHGGGLAVVVPPYMEAVWRENPGIFAQWAANVMGVAPTRDIEFMVKEGIARLRAWYRAIGLPQTMEELGIPWDANFGAMARAACAVQDPGSTTPRTRGVKRLDADECEAIYRAAL